MRILPTTFLFLTLTLLTFTACGQDPSGPPQENQAEEADTDNPYRAAMRTYLEEDTVQYVGEDESLRRSLERFYEVNDHRPAWSDGTAPLPPVDSLLQVLQKAEDEGFAHAGYRADWLANLVEQTFAEGDPTPQEVAHVDAQLSHTFMRHAQDLHSGRLSPEEVNPTWYTDRTSINPASLLQRALSYNEVRATLEQLQPRHAGYERLREAIDRYKEIADRGGWPEIPEGDMLEPGDTSATQVSALRERLAATGDLPSTSVAADSVYDEQIASGVASFQERHGLEVDSLLGSSTREELNVPVDERIETLLLNLERWHWLPQQFGGRYLVVNVPEYQLRLYDEGEQVDEMAVVVGQEYDDRATPIFTDEMNHLIFNPYWNVPGSIAEEEILPPAREDPGYLARNGYEIVSSYGPGGQVYEPSEQNLARVERGELRIRQTPGPHNALGRVKFMFPNEYSVYLHDTPEEHLFERTDRRFSHGCIRVERPEDLAVFALQNRDDWDRADIQAALQDDEWERVDLEAPFPVYILYWTAYVDLDTDGVRFRNDIYGHDAALAEALDLS